MKLGIINVKTIDDIVSSPFNVCAHDLTKTLRLPEIQLVLSYKGILSPFN